MADQLPKYEDLVKPELPSYDSLVQSAPRAEMKFTPDANPVSPTQARLRGAEQMAGLNLSDEAAGLGSAAAEAVQMGREKLQNPGQDIPVMDRLGHAFSSGRQSELQDINQAETARPKEFMEGQAGGFAASAVGLAPAAAAAPILAPAAIGAIGGAAGGETPTERVTGGVIGAAGGALAGGAAKVLGNASEIGTYLKQEARDLSVRIANLKLPGKLASTDVSKLEKLGDMLVEGNMTSGPARLSTVAKRVGTETQKIGQAIGDIYTQLDNTAATVPAQSIVDDTMGRLGQNSKITSEDALKEIETTLKDRLARIQNRNASVSGVNPPVSLKESWELAKVLEAEGRTFSSPTASAVENTRGSNLREAARALRDQVAERASKLVPAQADDLAALGQKFNTIADADHALETHVGQNRFKGNNTPNPYNAAARAISKPLSTPFNTGRVSLYDYLGKALSGSPYLGVIERAAARGESSVAATHYIMQQTVPEYRDLTMEKDDEK